LSNRWARQLPHGAQRENIRPERRKAGPSRRPGYRNECRINRPFIPAVGRLPRGINIERRDRQFQELGLGLH
jgi:hypothetical protein